MSLFISRGFCGQCKKFVESFPGSSVEESEVMAHHDHYAEFRHFFDGTFVTEEQKEEKKPFAPREPNGNMKPLKKKKHERY